MQQVQIDEKSLTGLYFSIIGHLSEVERLVGVGVDRKSVPPGLLIGLLLQVAEAKQTAIDEFAKVNKEITLSDIRNRVMKAEAEVFDLGEEVGGMPKRD